MLSDHEKLNRIRAVLDTRDSRQSQADSELTRLKTELDTETSEADYFQILEARSVRLQNRISPVLKVLTFQGEPGAQPLLDALQYFKDKAGAVDKYAPLGFLPPDEREAITGGGQRFRVSLYKALRFLQLQTAIKSGTLNLKHSYKYRPLDEYLIDRERWQRDKHLLLARAGLEAFTDPKKILAALDDALYQQYLTTNQSIAEGKNAWISFGKKGFRLKTPKQDAVDAEPLQAFFPQRDYIPLLEVLATVNHHSGFLDEFQHWQQRYHRRRPPERLFHASIIGLGCGIGIRKMERISNHVNEGELEHLVNWFCSPENTHAANDRVVQLMDRLELADRQRQIPGKLHTSSDGQKFRPVQLNSSHQSMNYRLPITHCYWQILMGWFAH